jgi:uncharacterized membrane protein
MPNLAFYHPQIVHFAVALLFVGVAFRWVSLFRKVAFADAAAATLLLLGTFAAVTAVKSGTDAHGPVERIPGARAAVIEHEEAGEQARNIFLVVAALELAALGSTRLRIARFRKAVNAGSAVVGLLGAFSLYHASEHGGELVYAYAGGVGTRYGDTTHVNRLLLAGLYQAALQARAQHRPEDAAQLFEQLGRRYPQDTTVRFLAIESLVQDKKDGRAALQALAGISVAPNDRRLRLRYGYLRADAFVAMGRVDSARATLESLGRDFPDVTRIQERLAQLR